MIGTPVLIDDGQIYVNINKTEKREIIERKEIIDKAKIAAAEERSESLAIVGAVIMGILFVVLIGFFVLHEEPDIIRKVLDALHFSEG